MRRKLTYNANLSDKGLMFFYFFLFFMASTAFCFLVSGEFRKQIATAIVYILLYKRNRVTDTEERSREKTKP